MASKSTRRQSLICALAESYANMMREQGATDEQFTGIRERLIADCDNAVKVLRAEPNGELSGREIERIKKALDVFHTAKFQAACDAEVPVSMLICMIVDQIARIGNEKKKKAFEVLLEEIENMMVWADPDAKCDGLEGFDAAMIFDKLEI